MAKRERTPNFSTEEVLKLVNLAKKHAHIIENKKTDAVFSKKKNEEWDNIAAEFNSTGSFARSALALKTKYENIKKTTKKKFAAEKQQL